MAQKVKQWISERADALELHFIPAYSPELNPDEYLNHDLKAQTVRKRSPESQDEMIKMVRAHLRRRQRQPSIVANFFRAPAVRYAA
jgi:transposase